MTETASLDERVASVSNRHGSIGKAVRGQELKLDENGEILVRGDNVSPGYWHGGVKPIADEARLDSHRRHRRSWTKRSTSIFVAAAKTRS